MIRELDQPRDGGFAQTSTSAASFVFLAYVNPYTIPLTMLIGPNGFSPSKLSGQRGLSLFAESPTEPLKYRESGFLLMLYSTLL